MPLCSIADDLIEAWVPCGARLGDITLTFPGREVGAGAFTVLEGERELLLQQELAPSSQPQTASVDNMSVTIPGGVLQSAQTMSIERIPEPQRINLPEFGELTAFSVTVGERHDLSDIITITFDIPVDAIGKPSAFYLDENASQWKSLPSEVVDNKLHAYTNHLTEVAVHHITRSYGAEFETRSHSIYKSI